MANTVTGDGTARTCYYCTGSTGATDTTTLDWWLNSWTLPVTADKRIIGLAVWLASETGITAFMPGTIADNPANGMYNPFIEDCGSSYSLKRHYKGQQLDFSIKAPIPLMSTMVLWWLDDTASPQTF